MICSKFIKEVSYEKDSLGFWLGGALIGSQTAFTSTMETNDDNIYPYYLLEIDREDLSGLDYYIEHISWNFGLSNY